MTSLKLKNHFCFFAFFILLFFSSALDANIQIDHNQFAPLLKQQGLVNQPSELESHSYYTFSTYNKFYNLDVKGYTFTSQYLKTVTHHLLDKSINFEKVSNTALYHEENIAMIHSTSVSDVKDKKRVTLINALWYAGVEVTRSSSFYQRLQYYEHELSKYLFMEYSKSITDTEAGLYLPGEITEATRREKKEYKISISTFVAPDEDTAKVDMNINCSTLFFNTNSKLSYSIIEDHTTFSTSNTRLNNYLGADLKFSIGDVFEKEKVYLASFEFTY